MEKSKKSFCKKAIEIDKLNKIIYVNERKISDPKKEIRVGEKLVKKFEKNEIFKIVISKKLKKYNELLKKIISSNVKIFDGTWLAEYILPQMVDYIVNKNKNKIAKIAIAILANNVTDSVIENIKYFAKKCKVLTVVTDDFVKLQKIEEHLYNNDGITIIVANNKSKTLLKQDIIINFDFCEEILNQYKFNPMATIINVEGNIKIYKKRFEGYNINDYEIEILDIERFLGNYFEEKNTVVAELKKSNKKNLAIRGSKLKNILINQNLFDAKEVYEALIFRKDNFASIRENIARDNIKIWHKKI